jgi:biotin carboxylase
MNFVYLSPHFPPNYKQFILNLHYLGVNVLGLADEPYELLDPELRSTLTEYYRVNDMHNYDELVRALGYFTLHYGKLDRIESQNEYWLETEARLRTDFNITGLKNDDILKVKKKSLMKEVFTQAGVLVARGRVVHTIPEAKKLIAKMGYPVVAKPDIGVGAAKTWLINNEAELKSFFATKPDLDYILEEYVQGIIQTFDGLVDRDGNLVFYTSHQYSQGIMEVVNQDDLVFYYSLRDIPADLEDAGRRVLRAYDLRERFFHFEFFRTPDNKIVALEVNMRPPGGFTTDMFNYANDIDIYKEWAHVVVFNTFTTEYSRKYHSCYVSRKFNRQYAHSHDQIIQAFGECCITHHDAISGVFSAALGDYGYLLRSPDLDDVFSMAAYIQELA